jgi:hypothetical protein
MTPFVLTLRRNRGYLLCWIRDLIVTAVVMVCLTAIVCIGSLV